MRACVALAAVLVSAGTVPAAAQTQVATVPMPVAGNTPQVCAVQEPRLMPGAQVNFRGLSGNTLQIAQLTDPATLATSAASADISFDAVCNYPHRLRIESQNNGLWRSSEGARAAPAGFAYAVPYRATVQWGELNGALYADASTRRLIEQRFNVDQATAGTILLRVAIDQGASNVRSNAPLLAGYYGDTLRVFVEPR